MTRTISARRVASLVGDFDRSPAYKGLAESLRVLISDGRVPVGSRLPSERELTEALQVSRTTVTRAYAELREHGWAHARQGSGTVAALPRGSSHGGDHLLPPGDFREDKVDLTCAAPLPGPGLLAAYERAVAQLPATMAGIGYFPSGMASLREAVAAAYADRGVATSPEQVMVVPGALAGVAIASRALLSAGDRVLIESPSYPNAIATLERSGARVVGAESDAVVVTARQVVPRAAYLIPDFHNPTGVLVGDDERAALADELGRTRTTAIVDESMVQLGLDGQAMPAPFAAHHPDTVSVGSLSKPFWGGLRVGWIRVPEGRWDAFFAARLTLDLGVAQLEQLVATELVTDGSDLLEHRRRQLAESRDTALAAVTEHLPSWRVRRPAGGLSLWCELPEPLSTALVPRAEARDVLLAPGPAFAPEGGLDRFVRIPYTQPAEVLREAVERIAVAWEETRAEPGRIGAATPTLVA